MSATCSINNLQSKLSEYSTLIDAYESEYLAKLGNIITGTGTGSASSPIAPAPPTTAPPTTAPPTNAPPTTAPPTNAPPTTAPPTTAPPTTAPPTTAPPTTAPPTTAPPTTAPPTTAPTTTIPFVSLDGKWEVVWYKGANNEYKYEITINNNTWFLPHPNPRHLEWVSYTLQHDATGTWFSFEDGTIQKLSASESTPDSKVWTSSVLRPKIHWDKVVETFTNYNSSIIEHLTPEQEVHNALGLSTLEYKINALKSKKSEIQGMINACSSQSDVIISTLIDKSDQMNNTIDNIRAQKEEIELVKKKAYSSKGQHESIVNSNIYLKKTLIILLICIVIITIILNFLIFR